jgi:hypothetical protein
MQITEITTGRKTAPLFELGRTLITPGAQSSVPSAEVLDAMRRHHHGDWGDLDADDNASNNVALVPGHESRLLSAYHSSAGTKFYIITEWDRSVTTVLLPSEY